MLFGFSVCHSCIIDHNNTSNEKADSATNNDTTGKYQPSHSTPPFVMV